VLFIIFSVEMGTHFNVQSLSTPRMVNSMHYKQRIILTGTVIKSTGSWYNVRLHEAPYDVILCRIIGKFRLDDVPLTNPVAVGDEVDVRADAKSGETMIQKIMPRRNFVVRQSPRQKHHLHLLASNIDQAVLIVTISQPTIKPGFIDRFLLMVAKCDIPVTIVFNKADLYDADDWALHGHISNIYERIGYNTLTTSTLEGTNLEQFKAILQDKTTLISGQSGVGKSTLVNAVQPQLDLRTGDISDYSGKGQHTTTFAEMFELDYGGRIIDTPGIKMLAFNDKDKLNVAHSYKEMFELSENCRFGGSCLHRNEPGCAVQSAVESGEVSEIRYATYLGILEEIEDQNYWERRTEF
jgi:ribosome biogenesis GTPase / thiamine phosphate phosphatase